jgi:uncharacterized protein YukE
VLTARELVATDTDRIAGTASDWHALARAVGGHAADLDRQAAALRRAWTGDAAEAACALLSEMSTALDAATPALETIAQALAEHAATVARAQGIAIGARVETDDPEEALRLEQALRHALALADASDAATAARLAGFGPAAPVAPPRVPPGRDPADVAGWWRELSPARRRALTVDRPELVGNLDGIPAADRDAANRARLTTLLADPLTPHRAALLAIRTRLDRPGTYLLGLSTDGSGRAIVAIGDPDTADNVVTSVPGLGGRLDGVAAELSRIGHLSDAARQAAPDESTSVIAWLGYDAPDTLFEAAGRGRAVGAESALHRFQAGLRATHLGTRSHNTVVGLSYGSTVVGLTGHAYGLAADDVVLIGSPGAGVAHAADLGLSPYHVWGSTARHDVINAAANPAQIGVPPLLRPLLGVHTDQLWYGPSPAGSAFGGQVFASAPGSGTDPVAAHVGYFDPGNPALATMAHIATGS